jgi:hypothetical protein
MPVTISGTTGITGPDGSASTPSLAGGDSNTGMFFPAADTIAFAEGGTEVVRIDSSGEVTRFNTNPGGMTVKRTDGVNSNGWLNFVGSDDVVDGSVRMATDAANALTFLTAATERARIDSSGNLLVGTTSTTPNPGFAIYPLGGFSAGNSAGSNGFEFATFRRSATQIGSITQNGTTGVTYGTSSDYRLKEDVAPITGALVKVAALKPCTYKWKSDGSAGEGFIAHELAEVCPQAVVGEKDAVNEDGSIKAQSIDTSFLIATLTAAIQEQQALITSLTARIAALEGAAQ